jgi:hypothetical protein
VLLEALKLHNFKAADFRVHLVAVLCKHDKVLTQPLELSVGELSGDTLSKE